MVTFLTYFLLLSGDTFRRKLVKITGPSLSDKKITVQALDEITEQIQRYLLVQLATSVIVGVATGAVLLGARSQSRRGLGIRRRRAEPDPLCRLAPSSPARRRWRPSCSSAKSSSALAVAGASLAIHTLVGNLLVPWLTSRASRMNPVVVFIGVLGWGWLWGVWGLLLGMPILMVVKAVCDRVEHLKPIGELLGD